MLRYITLSLCLVGILISPAQAETLKIYKFTSNFVDCVKSHEDEKSYYSASGLAESGLMNGTDKIPSGSLNGNYWNYMDCLSLAEGGTTNETLTVTQTCPEIKFTVNERAYYVPPSADGKIIGMAGNYWKCSGNNWVATNGTISGPGEVDITPPENEDKASCGVQVGLNSNNCLFSVDEGDLGLSSAGDLLSRAHNASISLKYGPDFGDFEANYQGESIAVCNDGNWEVQHNKTSCEPLACNVGEEVTWSGFSNGSQVICDGAVDEDGDVIANAVAGGGSATLFGSLALARLYSVVMEGSAEFACGVNGWQEVRSNCSRKAQNDLVCNAVNNENGNIFYVCN
jgi:hypothetical protein